MNLWLNILCALVILAGVVFLVIRLLRRGRPAPVEAEETEPEDTATLGLFSVEEDVTFLAANEYITREGELRTR